MDAPKTWDFDTYDWINQYDQRMRGLPRLCYDATLQRLPILTAAQPADRVLDLGMGTGNSSVPFLELGCSVLGLDPSEEMLKRAQQKVEQYAGRLTVRHVDDPFLHLPLEGLRFDIVICAYSIHHLDGPAMLRAIRGMKASLHIGGRIAIADTMFRDAADKAHRLQTDETLEDEYHPLLDTFPGLFEAEGMGVSLEQVGEIVWVLVAREA